MLRFQNFNFGSNWMVEYGNPDREPDFPHAPCLFAAS